MLSKRRHEEITFTPECDPDKLVRVTIRPLSNRMQSHITSVLQINVAGGGAELNIGAKNILMFQLAVKNITGLRNVDKAPPGIEIADETKLPLIELQFTKMQIGTQSVQVVKEEFYDYIPPKLIAEIIEKLDLLENPEEGELEKVGFTGNSSQTAQTNAEIAGGNGSVSQTSTAPTSTTIS